eukprot:11194131-Lingulodinium_polyedra.AAC.1
MRNKCAKVVAEKRSALGRGNFWTKVIAANLEDCGLEGFVAVYQGQTARRLCQGKAHRRRLRSQRVCMHATVPPRVGGK